ncbi:short-chain collagen C4 isoform X2 [Nematostella vectensis]|uniref:short-chain collagen C4 isoform X2 n=1 Tax=Nematostella vectensis TaxID=45351 RepID=UPI002076F680|nr:short-chain collagen C4 isoform X2 [Nematostella vectensis]
MGQEKTWFNALVENRVLMLKGRDGRDGRDGASGPKGDAGPPGPQGAQGPQGISGGGVQYVRWGRTLCPSYSELVYKGRMAGEHYTHTGGGVNYLCLTENPVYGKYKDGLQPGSLLYTTEYEVTSSNPFTKNVHGHDAPCAVCYVSSRSATLLIPGTNVCPAGWSREYHGYLMTAHRGHAHPYEFICVDKEPETLIGSSGGTGGALLYPVSGVCGHGVPCGPYVAGRELTCAVCTR